MHVATPFWAAFSSLCGPGELRAARHISRFSWWPPVARGQNGSGAARHIFHFLWPPPVAQLFTNLFITIRYFHPLGSLLSPKSGRSPGRSPVSPVSQSSRKSALFSLAGRSPAIQSPGSVFSIGSPRSPGSILSRNSSTERTTKGDSLSPPRNKAGTQSSYFS